MVLSEIIRILALSFVGLVIFIGLILNGDKLYSWIGTKILRERDLIVSHLDKMFITMTPEKALRFYAFYLVVMFLLGILFFPSPVGGVFLGIVFVIMGFRFPNLFLLILQKKRIKKFVLQMVDALSLMSNAMRSGLNVPQALQIVIDELPNPISQEFGLVLSQNKLGVSLEDALSNLSSRMPHDDIEMFTTSVNILKETGGNLAETFDTIAHTIRERIKVESKIEAMVSQGVIQGIVVVVMPFALGGALYAVDPERIRPMFTTIPGWVLLSAMMTLQLIGGYSIWKIVQVKV